MRFAFWLLISLIAWFFVGTTLILSKDFYRALKQMGDNLVLDWLIAESHQSPLLLIWFIGLCLIGALLAISFIFCSYNNLFKASKKQTKAKPVLLLLIHIFFVIIMALHLGSMIWGYKYSGIELTEGSQYNFDKYSLHVNKVNYVDDIEVLKLKYKEMRQYHTSEGFHYKSNYIDLSLFENNTEILTQKAYMLSPIKHGALRITLSYFYMPKNSDVPGVKVVIAKNYFNELFFIFYALEIISILIFLIITWKKE